MAYKALYRKYRPITFDDVVGQDTIVKTLKNAIENNKLAHAYLFCGPRGTGKTSIAKLLAKTVNCTSDGEKPCGKCQNCLDIQESSHPDVVEMDAATNNGVDEIRELIEKVKYAPMQGKYKVYIIDEVHMITPNAFNALLKTLEEPPEYCIFVLCTTEPHKILPTIVSRCQRFDFNKIPNQVIKGRLRQVVNAENIKCDENALQLISELAEGGMRDALSILDQCIAYCEDNVTVEDVGKVYGVATAAEKLSVFEAVKNKDTKSLIEMANNFVNRGLDIQRITQDLIVMAKETVIYAFSRNADLLQVISADSARKLGTMFSPAQLLEMIDCLMDSQKRYRDSSDSLSVFEVSLLKMMNITQTKMFIPVEEEPVMVNEPVVTEKKEDKKLPEPTVVPEPVKEPVVEVRKDCTDEEFYQILLKSRKDIKEKNASFWNAVKNNKAPQNMAVTSFLDNSEIMAESPDDLIVVVSERVVADRLNEQTQNSLLEKMVEDAYGIHKNVIAVTNEQKSYLINYFRSRKMRGSEPIKPEAKPEIKEEPVNTTELKLNSLFGKGGYDVVEDK